MIERERLTEHIGDGIRYYDGEYYQTCYPKNNNLRHVDELAVKLCEFEDKIENGTLLELPCKVGDTVYKITRNKVKKCEVVFVGISADDRCSHFNFVENYADGTFYKSYSMVFDVIGKTVFLTKEEAEKALEMSRG